MSDNTGIESAAPDILSSSTVPESKTTARVLLQQCLNAKLQITPGSSESAAEYVQIGRGLVVYVCFLQAATTDTVSKLVKSILNVRLSETDDGKHVSIIELPGDILIIPQATLGGRIKGKVMQYHLNVDKAIGQQLYTDFCRLVSETMQKNTAGSAEASAVGKVACGTYGNRQVLLMETNGPYSHILEI